MQLGWILLVAAVVTADETPRSLLWQGGFESPSGWNLGVSELVGEGRPGFCLRLDRAGGASQEVLVARQGHTMTVAVDICTEGIEPLTGQAGYAYAAIYQTDEAGKLLASHDFVQLRGTHGWQRASYCFDLHPQADLISLRCGIFQAKGTAWFDNATLVLGREPKRLDEVQLPRRRSGRPGGIAAILDDPTLPGSGAPSSVATIADILAEAGFAVERLAADQAADPLVLDPGRFDLFVVPTGRVFPAEARRALIGFLRHGGDLLTTGGYAFLEPVRRVAGRWVPEEQYVAESLAEAMRPERSLLANGGFELQAKAWQPTGPQCVVVTEAPREGIHCARVSLPGSGPVGSALFRREISPSPGITYRVSGWMRTRDIAGSGMGYMAVYQWDDDGRMLKFRDFAVARGTTDWQQFEYEFSPEPGARRLQLQCGLYDATGTAWFDDLRCGDVTGIGFRPINTAWGTPADGLEVAPSQIGLFDPSFPLTRVRGLRQAAGQVIVDSPFELRQDLTGWAASAVIGADSARWVPLLETLDRYGRPRGAAASLVLHYDGFFGGSCWAALGVENIDLLADRRRPVVRAVQQAARFMLRKLYLHSLTTDHRLYLAGEPVRVSVVIENGGIEPRQVEVRLALAAEGERQPGVGLQEMPVQAVTVPAGTNRLVETTLPALPGPADLYRITAALTLAGQDIDRLDTGVVLDRPQVVRRGPELRFADNYFTIAGRSRFLFGSDDYARVYQSASENPLTWSEELSEGRDMGLDLYENLQYASPGHCPTDDDWRSFRAMAQLTQRHGLVFMPGMLVGHNVAIGDASLLEQSALCREYARRLGDLPGLLYYINGDYQMRPEEQPEAVHALWRQWLREHYGSIEAMRSRWGLPAAGEDWSAVTFPPPDSGRWDDQAAIDRQRFLVTLTRRWNESHVAAVRAVDQRHPITSEYYQSSFAGLDLPLTIDGQDVANIGYFDRPGDDIAQLPLKVRFNDLRIRGKGVSLGEYGVKTHPAWREDRGGQGYHIARGSEEQRRLFLAVGHYLLGLGGCKVQNWCLHDAQDRVFPWGLFHPNQPIPKDVAYVHRNQSLVWRFFAPRYVAPKVTLCLADQLRLGNQDALGPSVAYRASAALLALHYDFNVMDDEHLDALPQATELLVLPSPMALDDVACGRLAAWVERGGTLLLTGDFSYNADRQRTRTARLEKLAGVRFLAENYPNVARSAGRELNCSPEFIPLAGLPVRPCVRVEPLGAEVQATTTDGRPLLVRHGLGRGTVYYFTDPIELADESQAETVRRLYAAVLSAAGQEPLTVQPDEPWLHVFAQPTARGTAHVVYNTRPGPGGQPVTLPTASGAVTLQTRNGWPSLAAATREGALVAFTADGLVHREGRKILGGSGLKACVSLDESDLSRANALLIAPFEPGSVELPLRSAASVACLGEFRGGRWTTLEQLPLDAASRLDLDPDRATCLVLICPADEMPRWISRLEKAFAHSEEAPGY